MGHSNEQEGPLAEDNELTPRERRRRKSGDGVLAESGTDELPIGGGDPEDPDDLLGPVNEFTLTLSPEIVQAAMRSSSAAPPAATAPARPKEAPKAQEEPPRAAPARPPPRPASTPAPESVPSAAFSKPADPRFARARPGSRSLPTPQRAAAATDPLTTGVVPGVVGLSTSAVRDPKKGAAIGPQTSELMLDGLDGPEAPAANPRSERLPEVPMPQPDTARARALRVPPQASAMRPRPAARPQRPEAPPSESRETPDTEIAEAGALRLEDLLTLADEPPEREDTVSGTMDLLSSLGADAVDERSEPRAPILPPAPPARAPTSVPPAPAARPAPPAPQSSVVQFEMTDPGSRDTLTGSLEMLSEDEPEPSAALPEPTLPEPEPEPEPRARPGRPPLGPDFQGSDDDPLATRPIPRLDEPAPPPPSKSASRSRERANEAPSPAPRSPSPPAARAAAAPARGGQNDALDAFVNEKVYREPILGWLASLIGLVLIVGLIIFVFAAALWIMSR